MESLQIFYSTQSFFLWCSLNSNVIDEIKGKKLNDRDEKKQKMAIFYHENAVAKCKNHLEVHQPRENKMT